MATPLKIINIPINIKLLLPVLGNLSIVFWFIYSLLGIVDGLIGLLVSTIFASSSGIGIGSKSGICVGFKFFIFVNSTVII